jgi:glycosyltransferase involved in cell wall biosynthesis
MPSPNSLTLNQTSPTKPIRILHVVGGMDRGGVETWLMHVLRHIDRDLFQMDFLTPADEHYAYTEELQSLGSRILPCINPTQPLLYADNFQRIIRDYGPYDLIQAHVHHFSGYVLWLAKQAGIKVRIIHSHSDTSSIESTANWRRKLYVMLMKWSIAKNATAGLAVSRVAAADLLSTSWQQDPRWQVLYCGIDLGPFAETIDRASIRQELGILGDAFVIGHVGRFESPKNHHFLLEIAAEIAKKEPKMRLLLIGIGSLRLEIEAKVIKMGLVDRVIFLDSRPDIPRIMNGVMDIFLFPSLYEGLCLVAMEAQAAGLPCIFSDVIAEEADIVKPLMQRISLQQSAAYWAEMVLATRDDFRSIPQSNALEIVSQSVFNIEVSVAELTKFYRTALATSPNIDRQQAN